MRIPVSLVVNLVADGVTTDEIIKEYPDLEPEDMKEALQYASWLTREELHYLRIFNQLPKAEQEAGMQREDYLRKHFG